MPVNARRPLICVLNRILNVDDMSVSFPMFEWFATEYSLYGSLNHKDRIPNLFLHGPIQIQRALPTFIQDRFFVVNNLADFQNQINWFQQLLTNMEPIVHYRVTTEVKTIRKRGPCAFDISPNRFLEMHTEDQTFAEIPHFWFDFSSNDPAIRQFFAKFRATIVQFHALGDIYHDTSFRQLDNEAFIKLGQLAKQNSFPFLFSVTYFQTLKQKKTHSHYIFRTPTSKTNQP